MSQDDFLDRLRNEARSLQYEPENDAVFTRLQARVRERVAERPAVATFLARWFRPTVAALALTAAVTAWAGYSFLSDNYDAAAYHVQASVASEDIYSGIE